MMWLIGDVMWMSCDMWVGHVILMLGHVIGHMISVIGHVMSNLIAS